MKTFKHYLDALSIRTMSYINYRRGWTTNRKIVVIESDDWGSIRMPNREVYERLLKKGIRVDKSVYNKYDTLASIDDFEQLYDILSKFKDKNGNCPIITANTIVANPDFRKIRESDFTEYFYEPFTETIKKYPNHSFEMWQEGIDNKLFHPQFHGKEHLNVKRWMYHLNKKSNELLYLFNNELIGIGGNISKENPSFVQALEIDDYTNLKDTNLVLKEGAHLFEKIFEYSSKSFIAPNYIWNSDNEKVLKANGVKYIQGSFIQKDSLKGVKYHYLGEKNENNQIYLTRNVVFEPSEFINKDWVNTCLKDIDKLFRMNKPAIICSHRVNFIGGIFEENRMKNLKLLSELLYTILKKWSNVEFITSDQLGKIIEEDSIY